MKTLIYVLLMTFAVHAYGTTDEQDKGYRIIAELDRRDSGFSDSTADMLMILRNKKGDESLRNMKFRNLEIDGDGDKSLTIFVNPRDVKGTAFLSFTHVTDPDDQWIFLPSFKRVKRISSNNKSGPFMGSEFAYEDLTSQELDKYDYKYIRDETIDGHDCFVVEFYPKYEHSGYTRQLVWVDREEYIPWHIEYFDRKNALLKTLTYKDYQRYLDRYWRAGEMLMVNNQTGKSTVLKWNNYNFRNGLSDRDFDKNTLKNIR